MQAQKWWTEMNVDQRRDWIREQAKEGRSSGEMANLACVTRNVIIGVAARAHIKLGSTEVKPKPVIAVRSRQLPQPLPGGKSPKVIHATDAVADPLASVPVVQAGAANILTLHPGICHWPEFENPKGMEPEDMRYCGLPTGSREVMYCDGHHKRMYPPRVAAAPAQR